MEAYAVNSLLFATARQKKTSTHHDGNTTRNHQTSPHNDKTTPQDKTRQDQKNKDYI